MSNPVYQLKELSIEITNKCYLACRHCSSGASPIELPNELRPTEILRLIKEAKDLGATTFSMSGGDPITKPEGANIYVSKALNLGYTEVLYYTTGTTTPGSGVLSDIHSSVLGNVPFDPRVVFVFSLESWRPEVNDYIMGRSGAWNKIVSNIVHVKSLGFRVWVHTVPMLPNWRDIPLLHRMLDKMGVEKMSLLRFVPQTRGRANNKQLGMDAADFDALQQMVIGMNRYAEEYNITMRLGCPIDFRHTITSMKHDITSKVSPCHAGKDLILVRSEGDVHPCAAWKTLPDTDNVRDNSLADIWENSKIFTALRRFHEGFHGAVGGVCSMCKYEESCEAGCPAQRLHHLSITEDREVGIKDIYQPIPDPLCPNANRIGG